MALYLLLGVLNLQPSPIPPRKKWFPRGEPLPGGTFARYQNHRQHVSVGSDARLSVLCDILSFRWAASDSLSLSLPPHQTPQKVSVDGALEISGVDVGAWLMALQAEVATLRGSLIAKDQAAQQRISALEAQNAYLQNQIDQAH